FEANFPVPTSRREVNSRSAIFSLEGLSAIGENINEVTQTCERRSLGSTGCQPVAFGRWPNAFSNANTQNRARCSRQAAANDRLAACAPQTQRTCATF